MNRRVLVIGGLVAAVGLVVYFLVIRDHGGASPGTAARDESSAPARNLPPLQSRTPSTPTRDTAAAPAAGDVAADDPSAPAAPRIYEREDGSEVRDHRGGDAQTYVRPALPHPSQSPVTAQVTAKVLGAIRGPVLKCLGSIPSSAFGPKPLAMIRANISIDGAGTLTVNELGPAFSDIQESATSGAADCIRAAAGSLSVHVDHPAVDTATLAFPIRPDTYRR